MWYFEEYDFVYLFMCGYEIQMSTSYFFLNYSLHYLLGWVGTLNLVLPHWLDLLSNELWVSAYFHVPCYIRVTGTQTTPRFLNMESWDQNSGSHVCMADTLPT